MSAYDIHTIRHLVPQRYPFLLIDRVLKIEPWQRLTAVKNLSINEPYFAGQFPGWPVMPGVLMIEVIAQATIVLYKNENPITTLEDYELVLGAAKARFIGSAYPGDQLLIEVEAVKFISTGGIAAGLIKVSENVICRCEISLSVQELNKR